MTGDATVSGVDVVGWVGVIFSLLLVFCDFIAWVEKGWDVGRGGWQGKLWEVERSGKGGKVVIALVVVENGKGWNVAGCCLRAFVVLKGSACQKR